MVKFCHISTVYLICFITFLFAVTSWSSDPIIKDPSLKKIYEDIKTGNVAESKKNLSVFKPNLDSVAEYHFLYGKVAESEGRYHDAVAHYRLAYLYSPENKMKELALLDRANSLSMLGYFYEARSCYQIFLKRFKDSVYLENVYLGLAKSLLETGDIKNAFFYYEKAGNKPDALYGKAIALHRLGLIAEADQAFSSAIKSDNTYLNKHDDALYYYGENFRLMSNYEEARRKLSKIKDPAIRHKAALSLGTIAMKEFKIEEAITQLKLSLVARDRNVQRSSLLKLAEIDIKKGDTKKAIERLEQIRKKYPYGNDYDKAILMLAKIYISEKNHDQAVTVLKELVFRLTPNREALDYFQEIMIAAKEGNTDQFLKLWRTVGPWLLDSTKEGFLLEVAEMIKDSGKPFNDLTSYLMKRGSEGTKLKTYLLLARINAEKGDILKAEEMLNKARTVKNAGDDIYRSEALIACIKKDYKICTNKILSVKKFNGNDIRLIGELLSVSGNRTKLLQKYEMAIKEAGGGAQEYIRLADVYYELGRKKESLNYYRLALNKDPSNDWVNYRIGSLLEGRESEEMFKKVSKANETLSNLAQARLKEIEIDKRIGEK